MSWLDLTVALLRLLLQAVITPLGLVGVALLVVVAGSVIHGAYSELEYRRFAKGRDGQ